MLTPKGIQTEGAAPYALPDPLTEEFLRKWFILEPGEPCFFGELARDLSAEAKRKLNATSKSIGGVVQELFIEHAIQWAPVLNFDNIWHLDDFRILYSGTIGAGWADKIIITEQNVRLVTSSQGLLSFAEFEWIHQQPLVQYLVKYKAEVTNRVDDVIEHAFARLVRRRIHVIDDTMIPKVIEAAGLESMHPKHWILPPGCSFLAVASDT